MGGRTSFFIIWASCMAIFFLSMSFVDGIGVGWGRLTSHKLLPAAVIDMLLANGVQKAKLYSFNAAVLGAFTRSNISVMMTIGNVDMVLVNTSAKAKAWVKQNITDFCIKNDVNVTHLLIGHEPFTKVKNRTSYVTDDYGKTDFVEQIIPSFKFIQEAIDESERAHITKVTIPYFTDVLIPNIEKPSEGDFRDDVKKDLLEVLHNLDSRSAPFVINIYPLYSIKDRGLPLEYAFFEKGNYSITDGDNIYTNVFDEIYDTFIWALRKNGFPNIPITVGQIGWPTDGDIYANISTAERFYEGFLNKMRRKIGTPLQPGPLDVYIYNLVDENLRSTKLRGQSERHYGLYYYDGTPKYNIDFSYDGGPKRKLEPAEGVAHMPPRWCVLNPNISVSPGDENVEREFAHACQEADCSRLSYGSSCNGVLDYRGNISYAFNMFFQSHNQKVLEKACDFNGLGKVVCDDPSPKNETCHFPLQILSTLFVGGQTEMATTLASAGERLPLTFGLMINIAMLLLLISIIL